MRKLLFLSLILLVSTSALAQQARVFSAENLKRQAVQEEPQSPVRDATLQLVYSDEGRAAIADYQALRSSGALPVAAKSSAYAIGEKKMFQIRNLDAPSGTISYDNIEFTLKAQQTGLFNIWVQTSEFDNGHVIAADVEAMRQTLGESTPTDSYNSNEGVVVIDNEVFGNPPNVDGDGILDVLVADIQDGYQSVGDGIVLGFFDPANLSGRNNADIIYLDSYPGIRNENGTHYPYGDPTQTLAHEYQHLIFSAYDQSGADLAFVNEGLSEWAEVVNGFYARPIQYLQHAIERRHKLLDFRSFSDIQGQSYDYQRAGLFTNYLGDRIGVLNAGSITRSNRNGAYGYDDVLTPLGFSLPDVIRDFHIANYVNDRSLSDAYGYSTPQRMGIQIVADFPAYDGTASNATAPVSGTIYPGGAQYASWTKVKNILVDVQETNGRNTLLSPVLIATTELGQTEVIPVPAGGEPYYLSGSYEDVVLVMPHVYLWNPGNFNDSNPPAASFRYSASWVDFESVVTTTVYDAGTSATLSIETSQGVAEFDALAMAADGQKANRFEVPDGTFLSQVQIDQPYEHDFVGSPVLPSAPRDFTLVVWDEGPDGYPGNELFALDIDDDTQSGFGDFIFKTIDLTPYEAELANLPPVVFVGARNKGTDVNYLLMTVSDYSGDASPSYLYDTYFVEEGTHPSPWESFNEFCVQTCADIDMSNYVIPIRASFSPTTVSGPTANEDEGVLPDALTLEQNYPNPFNPETSIRYSLPTNGPVTLVVYDMLGRTVRTLVNDVQTAGLHEVRFDASDLASGIYLYALRSGPAVQTKTLSVVK